MARQLGYEAECNGLRGIHCDRFKKRPTRSKCSHCGGSIFVRRGLWGAFEWTGDGRYPEENAVFLSASYVKANAHALESDTLVVRFVSLDA